jgi:DNA-directed RNA polymerase II subunit RPB2
MKIQDKHNDYKLKCNLYLGGKNGDKLYYGKPIIYDNDRDHYMYPNEARLRNMTYGITIHYDVVVEFFIKNDEDEAEIIEPTYTKTIEKIFLGRFPIMLKSDLCILKKLSPDVCYELGEDKSDYGGYFIIDGKEKCIVSQEQFANNMLYLTDKVNDLYSCSANIRSVSEDSTKPVRSFSINMVSNTNQIVVNVPNVRKPVPLFILMRALGVISDKSIIEHCLLDLKNNEDLIDIFTSSVYDAGTIFNQDLALKYISTFTKQKTIPQTILILSDYLLPHIGDINFKDKAYFIGYMVKELLKIYTKTIKTTDRDSFRFKRIELPGILLNNLFKEYYNLQLNNIYQKIDKEYYYKQGLYKNNFTDLIELNYKNFFSDRILENGIRKAFKGNWGATERTKRLGVVQDLNRLSYNSAISQLRKINLPLDSSAKVVAPRLLHSTQWGLIDPVDTPDGGNVGLHKHMALGCFVSTNIPSNKIIDLLKQFNLQLLNETTPLSISKLTKIFVNGNWIGVIDESKELMYTLKLYRRLGLLPYQLSFNWDITNKIIYISSDSGRLMRPIFYVENNKVSYDNEYIRELINSNNYTWKQLINGFAEKKEDNTDKIYKNIGELYNTDNLDDLIQSKAIIDLLDTSEEELSLIAFEDDDLNKKKYTHMEIHPSLILGVMGNQVVFAENNQLPRDLFACGQMKQAVSIYHTNFQTRIDKMGIVLNYGQTPLIKSRYLYKINKEQNPYGENVIVAIMCYGGYNVEDSILFNEGSVKRGLFRTTYYNMYETKEESSSVANSQVDSRIVNIKDNNVVNLKIGFDYSLLNEHGLIKENTPLTDKVTLIGKITTNLENPDVYTDSSVFPKKGQLGFVDKSFITEGEEGFRIAKVRVRDERIPSIGDKFCSRCGQKGTIGLIVPEEDMPFTKDGIRPDIIINPHALPSRMTIGQLVETLMGKACVMYGGYGDCTAFMNKGDKTKVFGDLLNHIGFHSSGNDILYNGQTGEQLSTEIFIGPTYYMRLKHMVKDKINYRARGRRNVLTRQTVQGRANDGGLRIGEMERDGVIAHGASKFLQESMLVRGDEYYMAICNKSGMISIYNESQNLFLSPMVDGPIKFVGNVSDNLNIQNITKYGRSFSILRVPYAFKLLIQELQTMNIQLRIITDENIDQIENMCFSDNYVKLNKLDEKLKTELLEVKEKEIDVDLDTSDIIEEERKSVEKLDEDEKQYEDDEDDEDEDEEPVTPEKYGWKFLKSDWEEGDVWESLIVNDDGSTERWYVEDMDYEIPNKFPDDWNSEDLYIEELNKWLDVNDVLQGLKIDREPNNWERTIDRLKEQYKSVSSQEGPFSPSTPSYDPETPPSQQKQEGPFLPSTPSYDPETPPSQQKQEGPFSPSTPSYDPETPPSQNLESDETKMNGGNTININTESIDDFNKDSMLFINDDNDNENNNNNDSNDSNDSNDNNNNKNNDNNDNNNDNNDNDNNSSKKKKIILNQ